MNSVSSEYRQHLVQATGMCLVDYPVGVMKITLIVYIDSITEHYFKHTYDTIETLTQLDIILIQP